MAGEAVAARGALLVLTALRARVAWRLRSIMMGRVERRDGRDRKGRKN